MTPNKIVRFDMYNSLTQTWHGFTVRATAILYDRNEAQLLEVCNGNNWERYNPVRNVVVE
jgi:hypothetical protein